MNLFWKKTNSTYSWLMKSDGSVDWDILPIIYDNATLELYYNENCKYSLWYKLSKNLLWKEMKYADIINENTWEIFSFQVSNIFFAKVINNDLKILAKIWNEIKLYENFWKTTKQIAIDEDKIEITPLWYFNYFVTYDEQYFYPLILKENYWKK